MKGTTFWCSSLFVYIVYVFSLYFVNGYIDPDILEDEDASIFGKVARSVEPIDRVERNRIRGSCLQGIFNLQNCKPRNVWQDKAYGELYDPEKTRNMMSYYVSMSVKKDQPYCLQCCGPDTTQDIWDLECQVLPDQIAEATDLLSFGKEFRIYTNLEPAYKDETCDTDNPAGCNDYIRCPIVRSVCKPFKQTDWNTFEGDPFCLNQYIESTDLTNTKYLHGYTLEIDVKRRSYLFSNWIEVQKCVVYDLDERDYPVAPRITSGVNGTDEITEGDPYFEKIILNHKAESDYDYFDYLVLLSLLVFLSYPLLWYCRSRYCNVCAKKLIYSKETCWVCRFFKADPPDPLLLKALEQKGLWNRDVPPEKYPMQYTLNPPEKFDPKKTRRNIKYSTTDLFDGKDDESKMNSRGDMTSVTTKTSRSSYSSFIGSIRMPTLPRPSFLSGIFPGSNKSYINSNANNKNDNDNFDNESLTIGGSTILEDGGSLDGGDSLTLEPIDNEERKEWNSGANTSNNGSRVFNSKDKSTNIMNMKFEGIKRKPVDETRYRRTWTGKTVELPPNPNILKVHPAIIYEAIDHPDPPERPLGTIPREFDGNYGKPRQLEYKNYGKTFKKKKKKDDGFVPLTYDAWVAAGKPSEEQQRKEYLEKLAAEKEEKANKKKTGVAGWVTGLGFGGGGGK